MRAWSIRRSAATLAPAMPQVDVRKAHAQCRSHTFTREGTMKKKLTICVVAALTIFTGGSYLVVVEAAAEELTPAALGCTLEQYAEAIRLVHEDCQEAGFDGGSVDSCDDDGFYTGSCWNL